MTPEYHLNDARFAARNIATCAKMIAEVAHNEVVTTETSHGDELLLLVDILERQTRELREGLDKVARVRAEDVVHLPPVPANSP